MISQGADERRIRTLLQQRGVGPDATPPRPTTRPRDWLDDILNTPAPQPTPTPAKAVKPKPATGPTKKTQPAQKTDAAGQPRTKRRRPARASTPQRAPLTWEQSPRQSLADAWGRVPARLKWLAYHASAAYLGWTVGLVNWATHVTAWIASTGLVGGQALFWYAVAAATFLLHHRTRGWWPPVAWLFAVPVSSTVVGVLLYGTPHP